MMVKKNIIEEHSLSGYFFDELSKINEKHDFPLSNEQIFYSSNVLDLYSNPSQFFDQNNNKLKPKYLGQKLLGLSSLPKSKHMTLLKEVGDSSLCLCGFFSDSMNRKIINKNHYKEMGKSAYLKLNNLVPSLLDEDDFYSKLSLSFDTLIYFLEMISFNKGRFNEGSH